MKQKLFILFALLITTMTASATDVPTYSLTKANGAEAHGTITFKVGENTVTSAKEGDVVTVIVNQNSGWIINEVSGQWYAAVAATRGVHMLNAVTLTPVTGQTNQWTFTMERANVEISASYKKLMTNSDISISDITALTYTGVAQTPTVTVNDGETRLVENTDYTVSYSNNTNAALSTATTAPTVTITAVATSQKYAGTTSKTFTIQKKALTITAENKTATFGDAAPAYTVTYDGFENNETATVLGGTLALACDYVQEYEITPSGLTSDNYEITFTAGKLTVGKKALESSMIAAIEALTYNGTAQTPEPVVTFNEMTLEAGTDYTVAYANNTAAALATATENAPTVTITAVATSQKYAGTTSKTFTIQKKALTITAENKTATFGDAAPAYTVTYDGFENNETATVLGGTLALACDYVQDIG